MNPFHYAAAQTLFAVALSAAGAMKAYRLLVDEVDDLVSHLVGLA